MTTKKIRVLVKFVVLVDLLIRVHPNSLVVSLIQVPSYQ
ncbi:hypothetical protein BC751_2962 [Cecembia calidifontis]|jgi:hypothetical protein|uniref:Uncharacterized protein n=1 Tax=Cecembia calidifontis TaxID=1187080 RepID=A0A4Q7PAP2_9BACT|nr:hypothetical protein BC751_2962 [Cecembia calidifontis]